MSTEVLLMALRKFFARRGVPASITSDNGTSFLLADQILKDAVRSVTDNDRFPALMASRGIEWTTITPHAPWQGAFYERLIKSVKSSLYKTIGNRILTKDELETLLIEVEGCLNCRPLTYQGSLFEEARPLRPIDFLVRDIEVTYPFEALEEDKDDKEYLPPEELLQLRTRRQVIDALNSTHKLTEQYWAIWHREYISSLRESHKWHMSSNRHAKSTLPAVNMIVLLVDENQPRNTWRIGRISAVKKGNDDAIREVNVTLPNGHVLRRPVNLLVPLEIDDFHPEDTSTGTDHRQTISNDDNTEQAAAHYNLRKRHPVNYRDSPQGRLSSSNFTTLATVLMIISLFNTTHGKSLQCVNGGVRIVSNGESQDEICAKGTCVVRKRPPPNETLLLPPEVTLHDYNLQWKGLDRGKIKVIEITCPATQFCDNVKCWFCTTNIFNTECNPRAALIVWMIIIYVATAIIYTICYVPLTVGKPCRVIVRITMLGLRLILRLFKTIVKSVGTSLLKRNRLRRNRDREVDEFLRTPLIALALGLTATSTTACQDVDIFAMKTTACSQRSPKKYFVETTDILKLNTYNQEACIRIVSNNVSLVQHRFLWKELKLKCEKEILMYTRNTIHKVVDAKRCPHSGSCIERKCEGVNTTSLIPELDDGNSYPGTTYCVESCGGPGCGCFYLSSGCLFYRIYHTPIDEEIYELFRCASWTETAEIEILSERNDGSRTTSSISLQPTIPQQHGDMKITLSSITVPPTPDLDTYFLTKGDETALWERSAALTIQCDSASQAQNLDCEVFPKCICQPVENRIRCTCEDSDITSLFHERIEARLPIRRPWITFGKVKNDSVYARIPSLVTAEILVHFKGDVNLLVKETSDAVCTIPNTIAEGCYQCTQGAVAEVRCSSTQATRATIQCGNHHFTVPCGPQGDKWRIRFSHTKARIRLRCVVMCGTKETYFEITGVLKWVGSFHHTIRNVISGENVVYNEVVLPDIGHIFDTLLSDYKQFIIAIASLIMAIVVGYFILWTCGQKIIEGIFRLFFNLIWIIARTVWLSVKWIIKKLIPSNPHSKQL